MEEYDTCRICENDFIPMISGNLDTCGECMEIEISKYTRCKECLERKPCNYKNLCAECHRVEINERNEIIGSADKLYHSVSFHKKTERRFF